MNLYQLQLHLLYFLFVFNFIVYVVTFYMIDIKEDVIQVYIFNYLKYFLCKNDIINIKIKIRVKYEINYYYRKNLSRLFYL